MKKLTALLCVVLFLFSLAACSDNGGKEDTKSTEDGVLTEIKDDDGNLTGYERRYHNDKGDITRWDVYDANHTYLYYVLYEYDDNDRLFTETRYKAEGFAEYRYVYTYDDDGNLAEKAYEDPHGEATVTRYDADGNEIERLYYDRDEKLSKREVFENGKWTTYGVDDNKTE